MSLKKHVHDTFKDMHIRHYQLSGIIKSSVSIDIFKERLKTELFTCYS